MGSTDVQTFQQLEAVSGSKWKTIGVKVKESELGIFNKQLQRFGWQTLGELEGLDRRQDREDES